MANFSSERELKEWVSSLGRNLGWNEKSRTEVFEVMKEYRRGYGIEKHELSKMFKDLRALRDRSVIGSSSYQKLEAAVADMYGETKDSIEDTTE